jgi:quinoprotein glucose dehydrogenase
MDSTFRVFDTETGRELWHTAVPASAIATPMTYRARLGGRQYVVVAAGGHGKVKGIKLGDYLLAFALP